MLKVIWNTWSRMGLGGQYHNRFSRKHVGVCITILLGKSSGQVRIRHNLDLPEVDFGLLFNCNMVTGHYSGVKRNDELGVECKRIKERDNYSRNMDKREMTQVPEGMVVVTVSKLKTLLKDSALAQKVRQMVREEGSGGGHGGSGGDGGKKENHIPLQSQRLTQMYKLLRRVICIVIGVIKINVLMYHINSHWSRRFLLQKLHCLLIILYSNVIPPNLCQILC